MRNVLDLQRKSANSFSIDEIVYVSRTYETRHGHDPAFIGESMPHSVTDKTNIKNEWQGEIQYGKLKYFTLHDRISLDLQANNLMDLAKDDKVKTAFTHKDQIDFPFDISTIIFNDCNPLLRYVSSGETRNDVEEV